MKARVFLPRDPQRLNRIRDSVRHRTEHTDHDGIFVEEILNSVVVVIQCAARRYIARQKRLVLIHQRVLRSLVTTHKAIGRSDPEAETETEINGQKQPSLRFATDEEIEMFIMAQIYQNAQSNIDTTSPC